MKNILPCPYCGGEVEVVKLPLKKTETEYKYRLSCFRCKMAVARGVKFEKETLADGLKRIKQYEQEIENTFHPFVKLYDGSHKASGKDLMISAGVI